jgi:hypothetical protein
MRGSPRKPEATRGEGYAPVFLTRSTGPISVFGLGLGPNINSSNCHAFWLTLRRREPAPRQILFSPDYCLSSVLPVDSSIAIMEHNKDSTAVSPPVEATETPHTVSPATPTPPINVDITTPPAGASVREVTSEAQPPSYEEYASQLDLNDIR